LAAVPSAGANVTASRIAKFRNLMVRTGSVPVIDFTVGILANKRLNKVVPRCR
jgi:hypothetical protein